MKFEEKKENWSKFLHFWSQIIWFLFYFSVLVAYYSVLPAFSNDVSIFLWATDDYKSFQVRQSTGELFWLTLRYNYMGPMGPKMEHFFKPRKEFTCIKKIFLKTCHTLVFGLMGPLGGWVCGCRVKKLVKI